MKIQLITIGKTDNKNLIQLIQAYEKRLTHYISFEIITIPDIKKGKNMNDEIQKKREGKLILKHIAPGDDVILLDEKGKSFTSESFADFIQKKMNSGLKNLIFVIGGPYGFSPEVYKRATDKLSLSAMTFSHQMVRLFFIEQLYRSFTILNNEPYHHR